MLGIVRVAEYPPSGTRSIDYFMTLAEAEELNYNTVVMPMIETAEGVRHIDEIVHLSSPLVFSS